LLGKRAREMHERRKNEREKKKRERGGGEGGEGGEQERKCMCMSVHVVDIGGTGSSPAAKSDNPLPEEFDQ